MRLDFRSTKRGYTLELSEDLFGFFILHRRWYSLSSKRGGRKQQVFTEYQDAMHEIEQIVRVRSRRGYQQTIEGAQFFKPKN